MVLKLVYQQNKQRINMKMCWMMPADSTSNSANAHKILHLQINPGDPWRPYTATPYAVLDYPIPGGSKGWATYQKLRKAG